MTDRPKPKVSLGELMADVLGDCVDHPHKQVGSCVYCIPCSRRLYHGTVMSADELAALRETIAEYRKESTA